MMHIKNSVRFFQWGVLFLLQLFLINANGQIIIHAKDYGIQPNTGKDITKTLQELINTIRSKYKPAILVLEKGQYDIYFNNASISEYYITNTSGKEECPDKTKHIGIWLKDINNLTIDGKGALFMLHGKMTSLLADNCKNLFLKNIQFDYERPTMSEFTVTAVDSNYIDVQVNPSSWYHIRDSMMYWYGENWDAEKIPLRLHTCVYSPKDSAMHYVNAAWEKFTKSKKVVELSKNHIRFYHPTKLDANAGDVYTMRDITRDEVGMHFVHCTNIKMDSVQMHFMHGLGIVSQFCTNIYFNHLICAPRAGTGRICSSTADMAHFSTCNGLVKVENSFFSGGHDDPINIHSAHLRIVRQLPDNKIVVRFMHHQTYGIQLYEKGDTIDFINHNTLLSYAMNIVKDYKRLNEYDIELTLKRPLPTNIETQDCIENVTRTPQVWINNNWFERTSTRGLLLTTRRKSVIENNAWFKTGMSAILISDDANNWFESGMVRDITIHNNRFIKCGLGDNADFGVITVFPENPEISKNQFVHKNIRIESNVFDLAKPRMLIAKSTTNLIFNKNKIISNGFFRNENAKTAVSLIACKNITIEQNSVDNRALPSVEISRMKAVDVKTDGQIKTE